jgi:hypothetical protein
MSNEHLNSNTNEKSLEQPPMNTENLGSLKATDPIYSQTAVTPLVSDVTKRRSHRIVSMGRRTIKLVDPTAFVYWIALVTLALTPIVLVGFVVAAFLHVLPVSSSGSTDLGLPVCCAPIFVVAMLFLRPKPFTFDGSLNQILSFNWRRWILVPIKQTRAFADVHALQIIQRTHAQSDDSEDQARPTTFYDLYEINLVLKDAKRIHVCKLIKRNEAVDLANNISNIIDCAIWDETRS